MVQVCVSIWNTMRQSDPAIGVEAAAGTSVVGFLLYCLWRKSMAGRLAAPKKTEHTSFSSISLLHFLKVDFSTKISSPSLLKGQMFWGKVTDSVKRMVVVHLHMLIGLQNEKKEKKKENPSDSKTWCNRKPSAPNQMFKADLILKMHSVPTCWGRKAHTLKRPASIVAITKSITCNVDCCSNTCWSSFRIFFWSICLNSSCNSSASFYNIFTEAKKKKKRCK